MLRVCAVTSGHDVPSSRFRVRQHISALRSHAIHVDEQIPRHDQYADLPPPLHRLHLRDRFFPGYLAWMAFRLAFRVPGVIRSHSYDITWLEREIQPGIPTMEWALKRPIVWDIDDSIWLKKPFGNKTAKILSRISRIGIAGNCFLADYLNGLGVREVVIVPTAVDTNRFVPRIQPDGRDRFIIGWTGTSSNFRYLSDIEPALRAFLAKHRNACLSIISDTPPRFERLPLNQVLFTPWSPQVEARAINEFDIGIMPLADDDWSRGKCAFKMLQYMACGKAVIVSPVGMNIDVMKKLGQSGLFANGISEWKDAFEYLYANRDVCHRWGLDGRRVAESNYSVDVISNRLASIFYSIS